jgi:hypothetical protein
MSLRQGIPQKVAARTDNCTAMCPQVSRNFSVNYELIGMFIIPLRALVTDPLFHPWASLTTTICWPCFSFLQSIRSGREVGIGSISL